MYDNVLVGVDGSANSVGAIALAGQLADAGARFTLAHVRAGALKPAHASTPGMLDEEHDASHELLERQRAATGANAELVSFVAATPGRGLHTQAEEQGADLLVVGSNSRGLLGRVMLGDDTRASLNGAPCAVAIAAHGYSQPPAPILAVGAGYDGSPESEAAIDAARAIAERHHASLHAMDVVNLPTYAFSGIIPPVTGDGIEAMLVEARARLQAHPSVEGRAVYGLAGEELAAFGDQLDLLVVGSRSYGPWKRLVLGSTSNYLQRHARCSLLVLPRASSPATSASEVGRKSSYQ
jgi:nucleotide-binding universal stress UspA family protein